MLAYRGEIDPQVPLDLPTLAGGFGFPLKYGYASVGQVAEAGSEVTDLLPGDRVFCLHPHQDWFAIDADLVVRLPADAPTERGVFCANLETAFNVMLDAPIRLEETVVVFGQGVVGLLVTRLARRAGAGRIVAVEPWPARRSFAERFGADLTCEPDSGLPGRIADLTDGRGADLVIEASGVPAALDLALQCAAFQSTVLVCSWYGTRTVPLNLGREFHRRRLTLRSTQVSTIDPALQPRWGRGRRTAAVLRLLADLPLEELITHRYPFADAASAYELVDERPEGTLQVVLTYPEARESSRV